jgi:hypothetical protein
MKLKQILNYSQVGICVCLIQRSPFSKVPVYEEYLHKGVNLLEAEGREASAVYPYNQTEGKK